MKIFSSPGVVFPGIGPPVNTPPRLISGLNPADLDSNFAEFTTFLQGIVNKPLPTSIIPGEPDARLPEAMFNNFIIPVLETKIGNSGLGLNEAIIKTYDDLETTEDYDSLFRYSIYFYTTMYYFAIWYAKKQAESGLLKESIRDYIESVLRSEYFSLGTKVTDDFYRSEQFKAAFKIDGSLEEMVSDQALGRLTNNIAGIYLNLKSRAGKRRLKRDTARQVKREFVRCLRANVSEIVNADIKNYLTGMASGSAPTGKTLLRMYTKFQQFAVGDGTGTKAMFDEQNYGLIFFEYRLADQADEDWNDKQAGQFFPRICKKEILDIPLLDSTDNPDAALCILYYGIDFSFMGIDAPRSPAVKLKYYSDKRLVGNPEIRAPYRYGHRPVRVGSFSTDAIQLEDIAASPPVNTLQCDIASSLKRRENDPNFNAEEMTYIIFKHNIVHPSKRPPAPAPIIVATQWRHLDNIFQKSSQEIQAEVFQGKQTELAALAAALLANPDFEAYAAPQGLGIGKALKPVGANGLELRRDDNQADRTPEPGDDFDSLRYVHGLVRWFPPSGGDKAWLLFETLGFVSPLRCTWETTFSAVKRTKLHKDITPYVTSDSQGKSYNCVLSAFRALALVENMIERVRGEVLFLDNNSDPAIFNGISGKLTACLNNAYVKVLLPTGMFMKRPVEIDGETTLLEAHLDITEIRDYY